MRVGVVSSGCYLGQKYYKAGQVLDMDKCEYHLLKCDAPYNFVILPEGYVWDDYVSKHFLPGGKHHHLTHDDDKFAKAIIKLLSKIPKPKPPPIGPPDVSK